MRTTTGAFGLSTIGVGALLVLLIAIGGWAYTQKRAVTAANLARDQAIVQRDQTAVERDKAITVAKTNAETITQLQADQARVNDALNALQASQVVNRASGAARQVIIQRQSSVPANAARAAPILGAIVAEVQADRNRRRGLAPSAPPADTKVLE